MSPLLAVALVFAFPNPGADDVQARAADLDLSREQRVLVRDVSDEARAQQQKTRAEIDLAEIDLRRELERESPDAKKVAAVIDRMSALEGQARKTQVLAWLKIRASLSKAQREQLEAARARGEHKGPMVDPFLPPRPQSSSPAPSQSIDAQRDLRRQVDELERLLERTRAQLDAARGTESGANGFLSLNSQPWARLFIDGADTGHSTPVVKLPLKPGRHTITLVVDGERFNQTIEIRPGEESRLVRKLDVP